MKHIQISNIFLKFLGDKIGSVMPMTALTLPLVISMTGVGLDVSNWVMTKRNLQTAADAAVIAAAWEIAHGYDDQVDAAALREAINNGYNPDVPGELNITVSFEDGETVVDGTLEQEAGIFFSSMIGRENVYLSTAAASAVIDFNGDFCMLSLDEEADGAITTSGSVDIDSVGCGMAINSDSPEALSINGNVDIDIGDVSIVGDYEVTGGSADFDYNSMTTGSAPHTDPYADLEVPNFGGCSAAASRNPVSYNGSAHIGPGVYCGGLDFGGNGTVELDPGVYIIDGGDFELSGGGELIAEGVTIILTNSGNGDWGNFNVTGNKEITITAPAAGEDFEGVALFQDRDAPACNNCSNRLLGTSALILEGAAYFPNRELELGGDSDVAAVSNENACTLLIAKTITLHGNPTLGNNCENVAVRDTGRINVRLVF